MTKNYATIFAVFIKNIQQQPVTALPYRAMVHLVTASVDNRNPAKAHQTDANRFEG